MSLSQNVIDAFVNAISEEPKVQNGTEFYATVLRVTNGTTIVRIDGSDAETPVDSLSGAKAGDRVLVSIKDHVATLLGNVTDPSATGSELAATNARIHTLEVDDIVGESGTINLKEGTFNYHNDVTGKGISWDGVRLKVDAANISSFNIGDVIKRHSSTSFIIKTSGTIASGDSDIFRADIAYLSNLPFTLKYKASARNASYQIQARVTDEEGYDLPEYFKYNITASSSAVSGEDVVINGTIVFERDDSLPPDSDDDTYFNFRVRVGCQSSTDAEMTIDNTDEIISRSSAISINAGSKDSRINTHRPAVYLGLDGLSVFDSIGNRSEISPDKITTKTLEIENPPSISIGNTTKAFNAKDPIAFSLADIGAMGGVNYNAGNVTATADRSVTVGAGRYIVISIGQTAARCGMWFVYLSASAANVFHITQENTPLTVSADYNTGTITVTSSGTAGNHYINVLKVG